VGKLIEYRQLVGGNILENENFKTKKLDADNIMNISEIYVIGTEVG
jgi:hypothetical protein